MLRQALLLAPFALLAVPLVTAQDKKKDDKKPFDDAEFVTTVASDGLHEIELGKLAGTNAKSDAVKKFGQQMVTDHGKANDELKAAAKEANLKVPDKMSDEHQKEFDKFKDLKGADFDKKYAEHMVKDHEQAVALFQRATKEAKNPGIKTFATKTLPVIQGHLEAAKKLSP
jgi:putative membrane protein